MAGKTPNTQNFSDNRHEAGDRAFVAHQHFNDFVLRHSFVADRPELADLAAAIDERMGELYQAIWNAKK